MRALATLPAVAGGRCGICLSVGWEGLKRKTRLGRVAAQISTMFEEIA
jgi:hypothetical protein